MFTSGWWRHLRFSPRRYSSPVAKLVNGVAQSPLGSRYAFDGVRSARRVLGDHFAEGFRDAALQPAPAFERKIHSRTGICLVDVDDVDSSRSPVAQHIKRAPVELHLFRKTPDQVDFFRGEDIGQFMEGDGDVVDREPV